MKRCGGAGAVRVAQRVLPGPGDFAHGRLTTRQPMVWNATEHLALAAIAFPFVVRCLLQRAGAYTLTRDDIAAIETFEPFADQAAFL